jgi:hypothetical protein
MCGMKTAASSRVPGRLLVLMLTAVPHLCCLQVLFSRYCPLLDTGLTLGMRLLYTSVTWCYGELENHGLGSCAAASTLAIQQLRAVQQKN